MQTKFDLRKRSELLIFKQQIFWRILITMTSQCQNSFLKKISIQHTSLPPAGSQQTPGGRAPTPLLGSSVGVVALFQITFSHLISASLSLVCSLLFLVLLGLTWLELELEFIPITCTQHDSGGGISRTSNDNGGKSCWSVRDLRVVLFAILMWLGFWHFQRTFFVLIRSLKGNSIFCSWKETGSVFLSTKYHRRPEIIN